MVKLFVEGGGASRPQKKSCRRGFREFLEKAGLKGHMPEIISCGSRQEAYKDYHHACRHDEQALLLVDSEAPIAAGHQHPTNDPQAWRPWQHLKQREGDGWSKPQRAPETDCHLMVQSMESWLLADPTELAAYFGQGFQRSQLPSPGNRLEEISKQAAMKALESATRNSQTKGQYHKGKHSFELLALVDPGKVTSQSPWANRFVAQAKRKMGVG